MENETLLRINYLVSCYSLSSVAVLCSQNTPFAVIHSLLVHFMKSTGKAAIESVQLFGNVGPVKYLSTATVDRYLREEQ